MLRGRVAIGETGMPISHGEVFQRVANQTRCVIASRAVGKWATGLLLESYATKGFHNKAKSCPWGPMAGFVMADPRFTKNPGGKGVRPWGKRGQEPFFGYGSEEWVSKTIRQFGLESAIRNRGRPKKGS